MLRSGGGGAVAERDLISDLRNRGYLSNGEIRAMQGYSGDSTDSVSTGDDSESSGSSNDNNDDSENTYDDQNNSSTNSNYNNNNNTLGNEQEGRASYAYLLDMPIRSLTDVRGQALLREAEVAKVKLDTLRAKSESDLWLTDLDTLVTACQHMG